jgi:hypothetical protein
VYSLGDRMTFVHGGLAYRLGDWMLAVVLRVPCLAGSLACMAVVGVLGHTGTEPC